MLPRDYIALSVASLYALLGWWFDFFTPSLFVSALALYVATSNLVRTNATLVRIKKCSKWGMVSVNENNGQLFDRLEIIIQNLGVRLVDASMALVFTGQDGKGLLSIPLAEFTDMHGKHKYLERGMIAVFGWKSHQLESGDYSFFKMLVDCRKQNARLVVYSQSYRVAEFLIGSWWDRLICKWNFHAVNVNYKLFQQKLKTRDRIPKFAALEWNVANFIRDIQELKQPPKSG